MKVVESGRLMQFQVDANNLLEKRGGREKAAIRETTIGEGGDRVTLGHSRSEAVTYSAEFPTEGLASPYELIRARLVALLQEQGVAVQLAAGSSEIDIASLSPDEARELIGEDGYFGVEQTAERIFQFAIGLAGSDPSRLEEVLRGIDQGFAEAEKIWGGTLPDISYQTRDVLLDKINRWREMTAAT